MFIISCEWIWLLNLISSLESWPATALIKITAVVPFLWTERSLYRLFIRAELPFSSVISSLSDSARCLQEHLSADEMRSGASRLDTITAVLLHQMCFQNAFRASEKSHELPLDPFLTLFHRDESSTHCRFLSNVPWDYFPLPVPASCISCMVHVV